MKRDKLFWRKLNKIEKSQLVFLEKAVKSSGLPTPYYPDDCVACPSCSCPSMSGLCHDCNRKLNDLYGKVNL